jgi:hypothetical protein
MPSYTLTNTAWGELKATHDATPEGHTLVRAACKACGHVTEQAIARGLNPFDVQPTHKAGCRFGPAPVPVVAGVALPAPVPVAVASWPVLLAALVVLLVLAGVVGHLL